MTMDGYPKEFEERLRSIKFNKYVFGARTLRGLPDGIRSLAEALEVEESGIEGVARLRFRMTSSGTVGKIEKVQSSESEILDSASIGAVYHDAPLPSVSGWVEIPIKYELK